MRIIRGSIVGLAGAVGAGVLAWPAVAGPDTKADEVYLKRNEQAGELVTVDDDELDDDDELQLVADTRSKNTRSKATRSRASRDNTRSNVTEVSRDRDRSRGDKTRDWTRDGGQKKRDLSANKTNDRSRNDTRGRR
ncbi:hypothetical protein [Nocardioides caldifontis]|uniref:hypothetical protein n=1 Tax=Nocardioides caldifontis TaxID=2588938 RepID=UPI0011DF3A51|nr:hypothetical protein [Nocardioides caldifontis]